jgi:hypothetical protein
MDTQNTQETDYVMSPGDAEESDFELSEFLPSAELLKKSLFTSSGEQRVATPLTPPPRSVSTPVTPRQPSMALLLSPHMMLPSYE